jgi:hypothetical protein
MKRVLLQYVILACHDLVIRAKSNCVHRRVLVATPHETRNRHRLEPERSVVQSRPGGIVVLVLARFEECSSG